MKRLKTLLAGSLVVAGIGLAWPDGAWAQTTRAGVVTTLQGNATVTRVSTVQPAPQVLPLKFRDDVFLQDRVSTGEQSIARILLGGKAVVTVREHSSLTITETANTSTIDISAGKIALAVAKDRMKPGERIDIKTPNAVAGVRGTVVITEVLRSTAQAGGTTPGGVTSRFTLLTGLIDVTLLDPATGRPGTARFTLNPLQTLAVTGFTPPAGPRNISADEAQQAADEYKVSFKDAPQGTTEISDRQVEEASNIAAAIAGGPPGGTGQFLNSLVTGGTSGGSPLNRLPTDYQRIETTPVTTMPPPRSPNDCRSICEGFKLLQR